MMEMIERYLYAVTHRLPEQQRVDIEKELRGLIDDMLEERMQGEKPTQQEIEQVLTELGNPRDLASKYRGHSKYLIGPDLFDTYLVILKIVGYSILVGLSVVFAIEVIIAPMSALEQFVDYLVSLITVSAQAFAWVTFSFWLVEYRGMKTAKYSVALKQDWSPAQLSEIPNRKTQIKPSEPIVAIIFSVLIMVVIIFSSNLIGIYVANGEEISIISIFNEDELRGILPFLYGLLVIAILRECMKLIMRQWNFKLAFFCVIINIVSFVIALIVLHDHTIWNPSFMQDLVDSGVLLAGSENYEIVRSIWSFCTERLIHMLVLVLLIDTVVVIFKATRAKGYLTIYVEPNK